MEAEAVAAVLAAVASLLREHINCVVVEQTTCSAAVLVFAVDRRSCSAVLNLRKKDDVAPLQQNSEGVMRHARTYLWLGSNQT